MATCMAGHSVLRSLIMVVVWISPFEACNLRVVHHDESGRMQLGGAWPQPALTASRTSPQISPPWRQCHCGYIKRLHLFFRSSFFPSPLPSVLRPPSRIYQQLQGKSHPSPSCLLSSALISSNPTQGKSPPPLPLCCEVDNSGLTNQDPGNGNGEGGNRLTFFRRMDFFFLPAAARKKYRLLAACEGTIYFFLVELFGAGGFGGVFWASTAEF